MSYANRLEADGLLSPPGLDQLHTSIFFVAMLLALGIALVPLWSRRDVSWQRRTYWGGTGMAGVFGLLASLPDWATGVLLAVACLVFMAFPAYFSTPYIKVGGKIVAFHVQDSRSESEAPSGSGTRVSEDPDHDLYNGSVTPTKAWWLMLVALAICAISVVGYIHARGNPLPALLAATVVVVLALSLGVGDSLLGSSVARGQYVQFGLTAIVTIGVFTIIYLLAYLAGRRLAQRSGGPPGSREVSRHHKR
jgi:hypothetical protein